MEYAVSPVGAAKPSAIPNVQPDQRPTADTAAVVRDPKPDIPLPIPASFAPIGAVNKARIPQDVGGVALMQRTLKPYGVMMLPDGKANQLTAPDPKDKPDPSSELY